MYRNFLSLVCILLFAFDVSAQNYTQQTVSAARAENQILIKNGSQTVALDFCTPTMFRVRRTQAQNFQENETWMVRKYDFPKIDFTEQENADFLTVKTSEITVRFSKKTAALSVSDKDGNALYNEISTSIKKNSDKKTTRLSAVDKDGNTVYEEISAIVKVDSVINTVKMAGDEHFFGLGERMDFLDQRGKKVYLNVELGRGTKPAVGGKDVLRANYCPVPFVMSTAGYGIFFHTAFPNTWDMGWSNSKEYSFSAEGSELDYYFIYGPDMYSMIDNYTDLTGKSPMLPRYAMGLHIGTYAGGTWKYETETSDRYAVNLARRLRQENIPFDLLWFDSTWRFFNAKFGNGGATFEWRDTFKEPQKMIDDLYAEHIKAVGLHIRSILDNGPKYNLFDKAKTEGNILVQGASSEGLVNFFDTKAVDWWWENAARKVGDMGVKLFKTDVGSAFRVSDRDSLYGKNVKELHNLFPLAYAEAPYRKFMEKSGLRGITHTREGYAGIQRYPYIWAGDWGSEWQWFEPLISAGMSMGLSGVGNWTHCMGGFEQYSEYDTELYVRWCQFGMFSPLAMLFGMDHPRYHEPWTYGQDALDNFRKYAHLRYALLPYIYTAEYQLYKSAVPIMKPLVIDFPKDENTYNLTRQYMFGDWMMICPVTTKGALSQSVYFPDGRWIDYETGEIIEGRQYKSFLTPLEILPIYIKAGAIIPMQKPMEWEGQHPQDELIIDIYPYRNSEYSLYEDDGETLDYQKDIFSKTTFKSNLTDKNWIFTANKSEGKFSPEKRNYLIKSVLDKKPVSISENGKKLVEAKSLDEAKTSNKWFYDTATRRLWLQSKGTNRENIEIKVEF